MKRTLTVILIICFILSFAACGQNSGQTADNTAAAENSALPEGTGAAQRTDAAEGTEAAHTPAQQGGELSRRGGTYDYRVTVFNSGYCNFIEAEDAFYFTANAGSDARLVYFSDRDYKDWMPLCPRPECSHDSEDCGAYLKCCSDIWLYDGYLWFVKDVKGADADVGEVETTFTEASLWRMRLDGTQHEKICDLPVPQTEYMPVRNNWTVQWHNKYLLVHYKAYGSAALEEVTNADYVFDLETKREAYINVELPFETYSFEGSGISFSGIYGSGDELYTVGSCITEGPRELTAEELAELGITSAYEIWPEWDSISKFVGVLNCSTGEFRYIGKVDRDMYTANGAFRVADGCIDYLSWHGDRAFERRRLDLTDGTDEHMEDLDSAYMKYMTWDWSSGLWFRAYNPKFPDLEEELRPEWGVYFLDAEFSPVFTMLYDGLSESELDELTRLYVMFQTDGFIFAVEPVVKDGMSIVSSNTPPSWYLDKSEIGTDAFSWHRWEP